MLWLSAVLIAAVSNLDNCAIGIAYGIRKRRIEAVPNLIIALLTMAATAGAMTFGRELSTLVSSSVASALGSAIIIAIGLATIVSSIRTSRPSRAVPVPGGIDGRAGSNAPVSQREAVVLGLALSLNNLGTGVGAGVAGIPALATTALAGAFSLLCVGFGSHAGLSLSTLVRGRAGRLVGGLLLVGVGAALPLAG